MNILYFIPNIDNKGGIGRIVSDKINYLSSHTDFNLFLCYFGDGNENKAYSYDQKIKIIPLKMPDGHNSVFGRFLKVFKLASRVKRVLKENKIDVAVNANAPLLIWLLPLFRLLYKVKIVHEFHFSYEGQMMMDETQFHNKPAFRLVRSMRRFALKRYDRTVALNDSDKRKWRLGNTTTIPNFTTLHPKMQADYSMKSVITVGRLENQKGLERLIDIWNIVNKTKPDWSLDIYGDGSLRKDLQKKIDTLDLSDSIILHGNSDNILEAYHKSSIFALTSFYEGFPLVLVEATLCGLPCISFNITGTDKIITDNENGYLVPDNDLTSYANKLLKLMDDEDLRKRMGICAEKRSHSFDQDSIMKLWIQLFLHL